MIWFQALFRENLRHFVILKKKNLKKKKSGFFFGKFGIFKKNPHFLLSCLSSLVTLSLVKLLLNIIEGEKWAIEQSKGLPMFVPMTFTQLYLYD